MEDKHSCLMVGLPSAGKSTYLAAFWAIEKEGNTGHLVSCRRYPPKTKYLDELKNNWLQQELVKRTTLGSEILLELMSTETDQDLSLLIPDFRGESFRSILTNNIDDALYNWVLKANSILFFIHHIPMDYLKDEIRVDEAEQEPTTNPAFSLSSVSLWTQNIMVLKYISDICGKSIPISICFSAWDEIGVEDESVEEWIKTDHPFFYNFVTSHFSNLKFFGVSAQGKAYKEGKDIFDEELDNLTEKKQRAYVYTDHKSYDITEPIAFLLEST